MTPDAKLDAVLGLFRRCGALLEGHFRLSSGLHSSGYLQSARVLQHPGHASSLAQVIADAVRDLGATTVLSPAIGGIVIGYEVARALGARAIFAEREDGRLTLRRGFAIPEAERVLVVEDVVTTGASTQETIQVARAARAQVIGVTCIIDRSGASGPIFDVPFVALARLSLPAHQPASCPLCAEGLPIVKPGSRPT